MATQEPITHQPMAQQGVQQSNTTVVIQQPGAQVMERDWHSGLFDCTDDFDGCLFTVFCKGCAATSLAGSMGESEALPCCVPGYLIALRTKLRAQQRITGNICDDCIKATFCELCVMCQMKREIGFLQRLQPVA